MKQIVQQILSLLLFIGFLFLLSYGLVFLAYFFIFLLIVGAVLQAIHWAKHFFLSTPPANTKSPRSKGRVIDAEEWHKR